MIFLSTPWLIGKFLFCFAVRLVVRRIRVTCFICILVYWSALAAEMKNMAAVLSPHFQSLKLKPETYRHTYRLTLFPLPTGRFSWRLIFFIKVFVRQSTSALRFLA